MKKQRFVKVIAMCMAILLVAVGLAGCGDGSETANEDAKNIKWYLPAIDSPDKAEVEEAVNARLAELGSDLKLELVYIDAGNYAQKLQLVNAGREEYDLCFTSNWLNDIYQSIANGSVADITDLLPKYAPKLYASMNEDVWNATKVDGKIYSAPNWQIQAKSLAFQAPKSKMDKVGMKVEDIKTMEDITEYLKKLHEVEPQSDKVSGAWDVAHLYYGLVPVGSNMLPGMIRYNSEDALTVINQYESPEFRDYVSMVRGWVEAGYVTDKYDSVTDYSKKGIEQTPFKFAIMKPGGDKDEEAAKGYAFVQSQISDNIINTDGVTAAMTSVSATSASPENAVKMLELVNTDSELINLIHYGIEGKHYEKLSDKTIRKTDTQTYTSPAAYYVASSANLYVTEGTDESRWDETKAVNDSAKPTPILGFVVDNTPISAELANCQTVINEQVNMLQRGLVPVDEGIEKLNEGLKAAGVDRVIEEYQRQLDEWVKNNK